MFFWDRPADRKQVIYFSFSANGQIEESGPVEGEELEKFERISKNLVTE